MLDFIFTKLEIQSKKSIFKFTDEFFIARKPLHKVSVYIVVVACCIADHHPTVVERLDVAVAVLESVRVGARHRRALCVGVIGQLPELLIESCIAIFMLLSDGFYESATIEFR